MGKLSNVERVERTYHNSGHFTIKNVVNTGTKGKDDIKLDAIYEKTYNSKKYSNKSQLESVHVNTSDFLVFAFNDYQNRINEEIYVSYPHILECKELFREAVQMVTTKDMYVNNGINPKYQDIVLKPTDILTGKEFTFGGQKSMAIIPHVIQRDNNVFANGILIFLNSEDIYVEMDAKTLITFYKTRLENLDLGTESALTLLLGLTNKGGDVSSDDAPSFGGGNTFGSKGGSTPPKRGIFAGGNNGIGGTPRKDFKPPVKNTTLADLDKAIEGGEDVSMPSDDDVPFTGGETGKKGGGSPLSLNNIMDAAGEIEIPDLEDGDVDF
jgi:hypothetical protein